MARKSEKNLEDTRELTNIYDIKSKKPIKNPSESRSTQQRKFSTKSGKKAVEQRNASGKKRVVPQSNGKYVSKDTKRKTHSVKKKKRRR